RHEQWTAGAGWLQEKTEHTVITTVTGFKNYWTHTLKADYAINVGFLGGPGTPTINLSSGGNLLLQGDVTVHSGGQITLTSLHGSVLGNTSTGVFNDAPTISAAAGAVRLVVEGGGDALNVTAGGNINITTITSDAKSSSLRGGNITSTFGNVVLIAPDDIDAANPGASLVKASRVELWS